MRPHIKHSVTTWTENCKFSIFHFSISIEKKKIWNNKRDLTETTENATIYGGWNSLRTPETHGLVVQFAKAKHVRGLNSNEPTKKKLLRPKKSYRLQWNLPRKTQHVQVLCGCSPLVLFLIFFKEQIQAWKIFIIIEERKWIVNAIWKCYLQRQNKMHYRQKANVFYLLCKTEYSPTKCILSGLTFI